ncbi:50S ribosomal protein L5 [Candidatus Woesearchaeota archaeon]|nr:50S ribosomal protein L5 [Candidatus Woesearchaeota archaeon]
MAKQKENPMRKISVEKITLNFGAGKDQNLLKKGVKLLKMISGVDPVETKTNKRIAQWGLRIGLHVGTKITLRGKEAQELLKRLLKAKDDVLSEKMFGPNGNFSFGIPEYIDIPGTKYDPDIGIMGLEVAVTITKPGYRVKQRKIRPAKIGKKHALNAQQSIEFMKKEYGIKIGEAS